MLKLFEAVNHGDFKRVKLLIGQGSEINQAETYRDTDDVTALAIAATYDYLDIVMYLVEHGADMEKGATGGATPLIDAVSQGHLEVARYLLEQGADRDAKDNDGWTPLHHAAFNGHLGIAKLLMVYGSDLNARTTSGLLPIDLGYHNTEEIKQAIRDEPRRRMDHGHKRATEQDRHPNATASASAQQEEEGVGKLAEEDEPSEPSDEEDGNDD